MRLLWVIYADYTVLIRSANGLNGQSFIPSFCYCLIKEQYGY